MGECSVAQLCLLFATPWTVACQAPLPRGKNTGVGCCFPFQGSFLTQELNPSLLHCQVDSLPPCYLGSPANTCNACLMLSSVETQRSPVPAFDKPLLSKGNRQRALRILPSGRPTFSAEGRNNVVGRKGGGQETQGEYRNARMYVCVCR